ncbi:MAG: type I methionyl aminopeptidase [Patescibacteria group bacterium]
MENKLDCLKKAGNIAQKAHAAAKSLIAPGVNVEDIEQAVKKVIVDAQMRPAFLGYKGYPAATCISVNEEVVHGIPSGRILEEGDVVSVDLGVEYGGYIVDTARTHPVGKVTVPVQKLLEVTKEALAKAITKAKIGNKTGDIGDIVQRTVEGAGFQIVRDLTGHGVGKTLQEPPSIPNFGKPGSGAILKEGMVLAIEPITTLEPTTIAVKADGWTIVTMTGTVSAHYEDTVIITQNGPVVLT